MLPTINRFPARVLARAGMGPAIVCQQGRKKIRTHNEKRQEEGGGNLHRSETAGQMSVKTAQAELGRKDHVAEQQGAFSRATLA
ncbi:MAG: hypothetical protein WCA08_15350 [Desulfoferrobacter sp.]